MRLEPVNDKIVVKPMNIKDEEVTDSGIILPDTVDQGKLLEGEVAVPTGNASAAPAKDPQAQWKEKYRLTMSNLISSYMSGSKMPTDDEFNQIDKFVKKILDARYEGEDAPF